MEFELLLGEVLDIPREMPNLTLEQVLGMIEDDEALY